MDLILIKVLVFIESSTTAFSKHFARMFTLALALAVVNATSLIFFLFFATIICNGAHLTHDNYD